jgi:large subunit ribosomal protein L15
MAGFRSFRQKAEVVYTGQLDAFGGKTVDNAVLAEAGLVSSAYSNVKLILKGDVTKKVTVKLQAASEGAKTAVQKAGGSFEKTAITARPASKKKQEKKAAKEA